jgi:DNA polymerase-3 subunit beta
MQIFCNQKELETALKIVGRAAAKSNPTTPVMSNIALSASGHRLNLAAYNGELTIETSLPCVVRIPGRVTIPATRLTNTIGGFPKDQEIALTLNPQNLMLTACPALADANDSYKYDMDDQAVFHGIDFSEFQANLHQAIGKSVTVRAKTLKQFITKVASAAGKDENLPMMRCVKFQIDEEYIIMAAASHTRMALKCFKVESYEPNIDVTTYVPAQQLLELARILPEGEDDLVKIGMSSNNTALIFQFSDSKVSILVFEGKFLAVEKVVSIERLNGAVVERKPLVALLNDMNSFSEGETLAGGNNIVTIVFGPRNDPLLRFFIQMPQIGNRRKSITTAKLTAPAGMQLSFNLQAMRDALNSLDSANVFITFADQRTPILIRPINAEGNDDADQNSILVTFNRPAITVDLIANETPELVKAA